MSTILAIFTAWLPKRPRILSIITVRSYCFLCSPNSSICSTPFTREENLTPDQPQHHSPIEKRIKQFAGLLDQDRVQSRIGDLGLLGSGLKVGISDGHCHAGSQLCCCRNSKAMLITMAVSRSAMPLTSMLSFSNVVCVPMDFCSR